VEPPVPARVWLFRNYFARDIGQFNPPFDEREAKAGVETHIDTLDLDGDAGPEIRGWVRTYAGTQTVIYFGIYSARKFAGVGYVTVGFPPPCEPDGQHEQARCSPRRRLCTDHRFYFLGPGS
jgi:hypothetical protein